ncbi:recombinase family protein [Clostridium estertheticum]|uniref:recombinase family protein n=1 Tax=Clostridium estertheticum TaxID=238834 RepID=UPI001CF1D7D6|nr:recombinase family protein [Clostridium estertheticum]MCB2308836.1 recombinase family protein [Clostridium estertheticum]MCB2347324.1 recombinase family protein [Clostridium estertheticum]MCB2351910.1 recombinase family protein [Clostridium estertheticum]WAG48522.1 recombinase family protein [Clostridium estertheticum]
MRIYGYARVSTKDQNLDRQLVDLQKHVDIRYIFNDKLSGKDMDRPQYQLLRKVAQSGDVIYIKSLDRLGRNKQQIKDELEYYKVEGVRVKILDIPTTMMDIQEGQEWLIDMINNLLLEVLSTMAEHERISIRTRQAEGIAVLKSKNNGKGIGRPKAEYPINFKEVYKQWKDAEVTGVKAMELLQLKKNTFYKLIKQYEES